METLKALITVLLPVRNGENYVGKAIDSVLTQSFEGLNLVISDNCSTDATPAILARYAAADSRVTLVRQRQLLEMTAHFNRCLDLLDSKYYMLLCHDDYLCSALALQKAYDALEQHTGIAGVYCDLQYVDTAGRQIWMRRFRRNRLVDSDSLAKSAVMSNRNLFGIPVLLRSDALHGLRYDTELAYAADLDLSIAMSKGGSIYHFDEPLIANRFHGRNATLGLFRLAAHQMKLIASKHEIPLSRLERLRMLLTSWTTAVQKWAFFHYLELRS